ncbi:MAG: ABC transporter ATP-binding protein [Bacilli bacterium]|nr:ABC transporter ATP-binding protein [Bacilli bacterium]
MHNRNRKNEKAKDFKKSIINLFNYCKSYKVLLIVAFSLSIISSIFSIIGPDKLKDMTNVIIEGVITGINMDKVKEIALFLLFIYLIGAFCGYFQGFIMVGVTQKVTKRLRNDISIKINKLPLKYFDTTSYGDILSRVVNDVDTIGQTMRQSISGFISNVTLLVGCIIMMFYTNFIMAITAIISSLIGFCFMIFILGKSQKYFVNIQKSVGDLNGHIEEIYSNQSVVRVYNAVDSSKKDFNRINNELFEAVRKGQFLSGLMMPIMNFVGNFGYVAVCVVGAILVINTNMDFGVIVAFMLYVRLFTGPLNQIAQSMNSIQSAAAAGERVFEFLEEEELASEDNITERLLRKDARGNIIFDNVKFGYNDDKLVIKGFSASIKSGNKVAIVGPTGSGKTTMVNLLMKFYDIKSGDIIIDGKSIKSLSRENVHDLFCMVLQDTWVFNGTVKENIKYNNEQISDEEVVNACRVVGLDHFIRTLPNNYDTVINDNESISAGQKQLLTIARASLEDCPFLILDEATSNVDTRTEELVQIAMDKLTEGRTSFIIAHRLSTIKNADLILVMKDGNIIEQGNHEELIKKNGFYAELYNSQFQN